MNLQIVAVASNTSLFWGALTAIIIFALVIALVRWLGSMARDPNLLGDVQYTTPPAIGTVDFAKLPGVDGIFITANIAERLYTYGKTMARLEISIEYDPVDADKLFVVGVFGEPPKPFLFCFAPYGLNFVSGNQADQLVSGHPARMASELYGIIKGAFTLPFDHRHAHLILLGYQAEPCPALV